MSYKTLFDENIPIVRISAKTGRNKDTLLSNILKKLTDLSFNKLGFIINSNNIIKNTSNTFYISTN